MTFLDVFKHLLPNARAWRLTVNKQLRQFFDGLSLTGDDIKLFFDEVWLDIFPQTTREISKWEQQFGLPVSDLTEQERRDRLAATWQAVGGQSPRYIQDTLRANGFDVFVHEWWDPSDDPVPGTKVCAPPRDPLVHLRRIATDDPPPKGYPLVNKVFETRPDWFVLAGEPVAQAGEPDALAGNFFSFNEKVKQYVIPLDSDKWHYFLYIGGANYGDVAQIPAERKDEFEALCLKICPMQLWLGIIVEYI